MVKVQTILKIVFNIVLLKGLLTLINRLKKSYRVDIPIETLILGLVLGLMVIGGLCLVYYYMDENNRAVMYTTTMNTLLFSSIAGIVSCLYLQWIDPCVFQIVVAHFGDVKIIKHWWPDAQLMALGKTMIQEKNLGHLPIDLLGIVAASGHDLSTFVSGLESEIAEKQNLVRTWNFKFLSFFGIFGLTPWEAAGKLTIGFLGQLCTMGFTMVSAYVITSTLKSLVNYTRPLMDRQPQAEITLPSVQNPREDTSNVLLEIKSTLTGVQTEIAHLAEDQATVEQQNFTLQDRQDRQDGLLQEHQRILEALTILNDANSTKQELVLRLLGEVSLVLMGILPLDWDKPSHIAVRIQLADHLAVAMKTFSDTLLELHSKKTP